METIRFALIFMTYIFQCLDVWADVKELRDHNQERYDFNPEAWEEHEVNVGIFLTKVLKLKVRSYNRCDINSLFRKIISYL